MGNLLPSRIISHFTRAAVLALLAVGCRENTASRADPKASTMVIVTTGDADILFPPLYQAITARQVTELVYDYLAEVRPELNTTSDAGFSPRLSDKWRWSSDSLSIAFHIRAGARWHDGQPVRASDIRFTFNLYNDSTLGSSTRSQLANIDSVTTSDSVTAKFWFHKRSLLQFYDAVSQMQIMPEHIFGRIPVDSLATAAAAMKPIGSGRYRFVSWKPNESIELRGDSANYRGAPGIARVIWRITPSPPTATTMLYAGEADVYDTMRPENVREAEARKNVYVVSSPGAEYVYMGLNSKIRNDQKRPHPIFSSRELRRALSMAVDRPRMVQNVFDSLALPAIGPTVRAFPSTDGNLVQLPHDPARSREILDSLGWRMNAQTGIRAKSGRKLRFRLLVPKSSMNRHRMAELIQRQLSEVGVDVELDEVEFPTFMSRLQAHDFEAALGSWNLGTNAALGVKAWISREATVKGGLNYSSYESPRFDAYADSAIAAMDSADSRRFYTKAYQTAIEDAPAIWLYEPQRVLGVSRRIQMGPLRADCWWYSLADWTIH